MKIPTINGKTLVKWGFSPGNYFKEAIRIADEMARDTHFGQAHYTEADMIAAVQKLVPVEPEKISLQTIGEVPIHYNIETNTDFEKDNLEKVKQHMQELSKVPYIRALACFPDACPSGSDLGTIPVGGVAVAEGVIFPGMHSADICCSVAMSVFPEETNPTSLIDAAVKLCHFGMGGRPYSNDIQLSEDLHDQFERNPFLTNKGDGAQKHLGTSGNGNHFVYIGRIRSDNRIALVSHYGSRKPGAMLYDIGINTAQKMSSKICPEVSKHNLWIPYDTQEGQDYWNALQIIRAWTKKNHFMIHDAIAKYLSLKVKDRFWNEHNFVFKRTFNGKDYFVHAKGATPNYMGFASDSFGKTLIPLNMAEPILIGQVNSNPDYGMDFVNTPSLGFAPHGAGRNYSRTQYNKNLIENNISPKQLIKDLLLKIDARSFSGKHDISEFPGAYKNADEVTAQIKKYNLTDIVDYIDPIANLMAGHDGIDYKELKRNKKERYEYNKE